MARKLKPPKPLINWVVVLGDFGRSPRMQFHTLSLSQKPNSVVHVIAYGGADPIAALTDAPNVYITTLPEVPAAIMKLPGILRLVLKVIHQLLVLLWIMLVKLPGPSNILVQNPPAIPTLMLCWLAAKRHGASLVIDWHNFGHSIMALKHAPDGALVRFARSHEVSWGRMANKSFCVTRAMQQELAGPSWQVPATVLYDRPPRHFGRTGAVTAHDLLVKLAPSLAGDSSKGFPLADFAARQSTDWGPTLTIATSAAVCAPEHGRRSAGGIETAWRGDRPAIVISSTSWTPDEDFGILLDALFMYEAKVAELGAALPSLLVLITGRGPQRDMYMQRVKALNMHHVAVRSIWLEAADYPLILGAADLGVSLHASSSGLDLPMKVVDMFGAGLPVCALSYNCIGELVEDGQTGLLFSKPRELCDQLERLLWRFPGAPAAELTHLQEQVAKTEQGLRWEENWDAVAWPLLSQK